MARQTRKSRASSKADTAQTNEDAQDAQDDAELGAEHPQDTLNDINAQAEGTASDAVNSQVEATLNLLRRQMEEDPDGLAKTGLELATSQALSIAVQDAVDHLRRVEMLTEATLARAIAPGDSAKGASGSPQGSTAVDAARANLKDLIALARSTGAKDPARG